MIIAITFVLYLVVILVIGIAAYRRTGNLVDYVLGGRRLGRWVGALSAQASDMSGWLLLGLPGLAYVAGLESGWLVAGLALGTYLNWKFVARRLREQTENCGNAITLPEYFEARFSDTTNLLRVVTAFFILIFFTVYVSSGLVAGGRLFETVFGFPYEGAVLLGLAAILLYTFMGGFLAVSWTDFFQAILMFLALLATALIGIAVLGGLAAGTDTVRDVNPELLNPFTDGDGQVLGIIAILSLLGWGLGYFGQPHILARFMAMEKPADIPFARRVAMVWVTVCLIAAASVGLLATGILETPLEGAVDPERVFILMVDALFHPAVAGVCLAAILAAIMSTVDSQLLVASSTVSEDFYRRFSGEHSERQLLWTGRGAVVLVALAAFFFSRDPESRILDMVGYAWAGFGAAFGPAILLSLFWPRMNFAGALAGILTGGLTVIIWARLEGGLFDLYELIPGFLLSAIAIVTGTLLLDRRKER